MIKADSNRLLKALVISIIFHAFMFGGMNLLNWFPELVIPERLAPVTLRIERVSSAPVTPLVEEIDTGSAELPEQTSPSTAPEITNQPPEIEASSSAAMSSVPVEAENDPYANLRIKDNSIFPLPVPVQDEPVETKTDYVPIGGNIVNLEDAEPLDSGEVVSSGAAIVTQETRIVSGETIDNLETALANTENQASSDPVVEPNSDYKVSEYADELFKFDTLGVERELVTSTLPEFPDDLPSDFPPEITYRIRFSLNSDGLVKVLSIDPSSVYPKIDASIRKALRSWIFNRSSGNEVVEGTITLIFKAK